MSWLSQAWNWVQTEALPAITNAYDPGLADSFAPPVQSPTAQPAPFQSPVAQESEKVLTKVSQSIKSAASAAMQASATPFYIPMLSPNQSVSENIFLQRRNPDDAAAGALAGGGNSAISLAPLGLRGAGGGARTTILGA